MKHKLLMLSLLAILNINISYATSSITTASIVTDTLRGLPNCIHYKVIGMCNLPPFR